MIKNSNKFRFPAIHFQQYGYYTSAPKGTTAYKEYWDEESKRCLYGWVAEDGDFISGYNYFYLNYSPIPQVIEKEVKTGDVIRKISERVLDFPLFYDRDYDFFNYIEEAERNGKHASILKKRRAGYSLKARSMLCRNFYLIPGSLSIAVAAEAEFLTKDGILSKAWDLISWLDQNTAWTKKRQKIDTKMHKRASYIIDKEGTKIEAGFLSEIMGVTVKNDVNKIRGKAAKLILFEEAGKFPDLKEAWTIARPSVEQGTNVFGLLLAFGTGGGEDSDYEGLKDLFYEPVAYNIQSVPNIWDDGASNHNCGFFVAEYDNMQGNDEEGNSFMDKDGNSLKNIAIKHILKERQKVVESASDRNAIDRYIAERPMSPAEAFLTISGNIFPKKELLNHLSYIKNNESLKNYKQQGDLFFDAHGVLKWKQGNEFKSINKYRLTKDDSREGAITIWEHPMDNPPYGMYISGCLTPGEKVITTEGLKNVEDVTLDNKLINKDGEEVGINTLLRYDKVNEPTYRVKMSNIYRTTNYTQEHPLYLSTTPYNSNLTINESKFKFDFIRARDIKEGMWTKYPNVYKKSKPYTLPFKLSNEDYFWWFIGLWLGDGWVDDDKVYIAFNKAEQVYIDHAYTFVEDILNRKPYSRVRSNCVEFSFGHRELSKFLTTTFGKGALNKRLPEWVKYISYAYKCNLIQGYLDSDGCITKHTKGYYSTEFVSISQELLEGFQDILFSIGVVSNMSLMRNGKESTLQGIPIKQLPTWHLRLSHHSTLQLIRDLPFTDDIKIKRIDFNNLPNVRRQPKDGCFISEDGEYIYLQIKGIEQSEYTGIVYNFDCDTHSFITQYCTTHNCDPYDHNQSGTDSLGSVFIYKRFTSFEYTYDLIVAEYTGRPNTAEQFYETVRKLLIYYNAKLLFENQNPGILTYFRNKHSEYMLAEQPSIIDKIIKNSTVNRGKGIHMTVEIKNWAEGRLRDWLIEEYEPGKKNLTKIYSEPLLEELIAFNDKGNFDRVMALFSLFIYKEELYNIAVKSKEDIIKQQRLFEKPLFDITTREFSYF